MKPKSHGLFGLMLTLLLVGSAPAWSQLPEPNQMGVSMSHVHFVVPNPERHQHFWEAMGGRVERAGPMQYIAFPGSYILLSEGQPEAPSTDTAVHHIGFSVQDLEHYRSKLQAMGLNLRLDDLDQGLLQIELRSGIRVEFLSRPEQEAPIAFHHVHLRSENPGALQDWYARVFGASPGERRGRPSAILPGVRLDMMGLRGENTPRPTRGSALHHIGFEVRDMEAFTQHLKGQDVSFEIEPRHIESIGLTVGFITDPAGTFIEISQGMADFHLPRAPRGKSHDAHQH